MHKHKDSLRKTSLIRVLIRELRIYLHQLVDHHNQYPSILQVSCAQVMQEVKGVKGSLTPSNVGFDSSNDKMELPFSHKSSNWVTSLNHIFYGLWLFEKISKISTWVSIDKHFISMMKLLFKN